MHGNHAISIITFQPSWSVRNKLLSLARYVFKFSNFNSAEGESINQNRSLHQWRLQWDIGASRRERRKNKQGNSKIDVSSNKGKPLQGHNTSDGDKRSSTTHELLNVLREQAAWKSEQLGYARGGPIVQDYTHVLHGGKRPFSAMGVDAPAPDLRAYSRARIDSSLPVTSSNYVALPHGLLGSSLSYYQHPGAGYAPGPLSGASDYLSIQRRQGGAPY